VKVKHEEKTSAPKGEPKGAKLGPTILEVPESKLDEVGGAHGVAELLGMSCRGCTIANGVARVELDHS
jgi:hypothetical protein